MDEKMEMPQTLIGLDRFAPNIDFCTIGNERSMEDYYVLYEEQAGICVAAQGLTYKDDKIGCRRVLSYCDLSESAAIQEARMIKAARMSGTWVADNCKKKRVNAFDVLNTSLEVVPRLS